MPAIKAEVADQVKYCLNRRYPWSWASPRGLHTDGVILWYYTLPIACLEQPFVRVYAEEPRIIGYAPKGFPPTTTQVVNAVVRPIADVMYEVDHEFNDVLQRARAHYSGAYLPTGTVAMAIAKALREWGQGVTE